MRVLIIAATEFELQPFLEVSANFPNCDILLTGVGMIASAFALGSQTAIGDYDVLINVGIGGSFDSTIQIGEVIQVTSEQFVELGAEDGDHFISIDDLGFGKSRFESIPSLWNKAFLPFVKQGAGMTVNTVHGHEGHIADICRRHPDITIESMEGGTVFYAGAKKGIPVLELRGVSNYVERRNRATWNIPLAIMNSNKALIQTIEYLDSLEHEESQI